MNELSVLCDLEGHLGQLIAVDEEKVGLPAWEAIGCALHGTQRRLQDVDPVDLCGIYNLPAQVCVGKGFQVSGIRLKP